MPAQLGPDVGVYFKAQSALGTEEAAGGGATQLLYNIGSPGFQFPDFASVDSNINYADGMTTKPNRGSFNVPGTFSWDVIATAHNPLYATSMRGAVTASTTIDETDMSSATLSVSSNVITFSAGDIIAAGVKIGDCIQIPTGLDAADTSKWLPVVAVTATSITSGVAITDVAGPVASYTIRLPNKVLPGTTGSLLTLEQYYQQLDRSVVLSDVRGGNLAFSQTEDNKLQCTQTLMATTRASKASGSSPHFTSPSVPSGSALEFLDGCLLIGSTIYANATGFSADFTMPLNSRPVMNKTGASPDIYQGLSNLTANMSFVFDSLDYIEQALADNDNAAEIIALYSNDDNEMFGIHLPKVGVDPDSLSNLGEDGDMVATLAFRGGADRSGGAADLANFKIMNYA